MPVDPSHLLYLEDPTAEGNFITSPAFCENCGYNLRMLRPMGRCPECGSRYNVKKNQGIFIPQAVDLPAFDIFAALVSLLMLIWLVSRLITQFELWALLFGAIFGVLSPIYIKQAWKGLKKFIQAQKLLNCLNEEDTDE